jgi:hypothetical protein
LALEVPGVQQTVLMEQAVVIRFLLELPQRLVEVAEALIAMRVVLEAQVAVGAQKTGLRQVVPVHLVKATLVVLV